MNKELYGTEINKTKFKHSATHEQEYFDLFFINTLSYK